jgi:hypothetical protein
LLLLACCHRACLRRLLALFARLLHRCIVCDQVRVSLAFQPLPLRFLLRPGPPGPPLFPASVMISQPHASAAPQHASPRCGVPFPCGSLRPPHWRRWSPPIIEGVWWCALAEHHSPSLGGLT